MMVSPRPRIVPLDPREAMNTKEAAHIAGRTARRMCDWCRDFGLGRQIAGGPWMISRPLFHLFIERGSAGRRAIRGYLDGEPIGELVTEYYERFGLGDLLKGR